MAVLEASGQWPSILGNGIARSMDGARFVAISSKPMGYEGYQEWYADQDPQTRLRTRPATVGEQTKV